MGVPADVPTRSRQTANGARLKPVTEDVRRWLTALPKAELHVHLEGTVAPQSLRRIGRRNGVTLPANVDELYACHDFQSFLRAFVQVVRVLQRPDDFYEITTEYLELVRQQGVRHVEFLFSPATLRHFFANTDLETIVGAIHAASQSACAAHGISSLLIFDMVRNLGVEAAAADIELAIRCRQFGVVGVGLGGDEAKFPARDFKNVYARAKSAGLALTAHAGEAAGADSVDDAVLLLGATRIGHGTAAVGHPNTLSLLLQKQISIDVCPSSNEITGAWNQTQPHPLLAFLDAKIPVMLSSDDPAFFQTTLVSEYEKAAALGVGRADLAQIAADSFRHSFAADSEKSTWLQALRAYTGGEPHGGSVYCGRPGVTL
ncbi:MAG: adenosine deaminase [Candidatus Eremiobacter antarcticus]